MTTSNTALSVDEIHEVIKKEISQIMITANNAINPIMTTHLTENAKTLSRLYSKLTNDFTEKRTDLDLITGDNKQTSNYSRHSKSLDGNTVIKKLSTEVAASL